jgi:hypothetical protein
MELLFVVDDDDDAVVVVESWGLRWAHVRFLL